MKFSCTQENLDKALQLVGHVASKNVNLPILQNILLQAEDNRITLSSTNLEIGIKVILRGKVDEAGEFTVPAQLFTSYVHLLNSERVDCELNDKEFLVQAGEQHTIIKGELAAEFPILPSIQKERAYIVNKDEFEVSLQQTLIAASMDETRPEIAGVLFLFNKTDLVLAGTDGHRLAEKKVMLTQNASSEIEKIILPHRSAQELLRLVQNSPAEHVSIYIHDNQFGCDIGDVELVSRVIEGQYPDYEAIIPQVSQLQTVVEVQQLIKAIKSAALFSKTGINDVELDFDVDAQLLTVRSINTQLGEHTATLPFSGHGSSVKVVFNYRYVLDALQYIHAPKISMQINDAMSSVVVKPEGQSSYINVIMPITQ